MEQFESIKKTISPDDITYWVARELSHELSISYDQFLPYITGAIANCKNNWYDSSFHFTQIDDDYQLSQYACYILIEKLTIADADYHRKIKNYFYTKDFQWRNNEKQKVHEWSYESKTGNPKYTNEREIRNTKRGVNVWAETDWKGKYLRPVLISSPKTCIIYYPIWMKKTPSPIIISIHLPQQYH